MNKVITSEDKQLRLPWLEILCIIFGTVLLGLLFMAFGRLDLAKPSLLFAAMVALTIAMRWRLRRHVWFWLTMAVLAALHLPVILFVPWTHKWIPAIVESRPTADAVRLQILDTYGY